MRRWSGTSAEIEQLVILGAGLDTRSYRLPSETRVRCFEVDTPRTQALKREMLDRAGVDASRVTFVPADFEEEDWFEKLVAAGFDPSKRTFFLWESVTMYLDPEAVESTLRRIAGTASGSVVAFDYFTNAPLGAWSIFLRTAEASAKLFGEPFGTFRIDSTPPGADSGRGLPRVVRPRARGAPDLRRGDRAGWCPRGLRRRDGTCGVIRRSAAPGPAGQSRTR